MIRDDRELLAELARLNTDMPILGLRIVEGSASAAEQGHYAQRLIAVGERLKQRAGNVGPVVIDGTVDQPREPLALPTATAEPVDLDWRA